MEILKSNRRGQEILKNARAHSELDLTIFVPCRNEEGNISNALNEIVTVLKDYAYTYEIIVIDDDSKDSTPQKVKEFIKLNPEINIIFKQNATPLGVSYNFSDAAILGRGKYFRMIGGHFQDRKEAMHNAFKHLGKADIIITYMSPDLRKPIRRLFSKTYTKLVNFVSGYNIAHYHGTPIHNRIDIVRWHSYRSVGFYADITTRLLDEGVSYIEVPTAAFERETGKSLALRWRNVISLLIGLTDMLMRRFSKERVKPICIKDF